ncbi:NUDIX hydrolase domain-containingprotein [Purpureocillium lavendulum]|uniref:NUDIX hydrolase domain-containingprotein n=1 Tax=Purpureocillium lavendulum TaxID=1247861 RepID=A0AB34FNK6_9HYPO|nr:NUDIX hydrolase domain-containingprotein [Purpureocillium lavendulum]
MPADAASGPGAASVRLLDLINVTDKPADGSPPHARRATSVPLDFETNHAPYYRFFLAPDPRPHGFIHPDTVAKLPWPAAFIVDHAARSVTVSPPPEGTSLSDHANAALQEAVDAAVAAPADFPTLNGLHSEYFVVPGARAFVQVERFAAPLFGIASRGAHLTCYVRDHDDGDAATTDGERLRIWVARRSLRLFTYPGMLDSTVAGGVKADDSPRDCIEAEAGEEASLPSELVTLSSPSSAAGSASPLRSVGTVTLANRNARTGLFHSEVLYVYDMEMPPGVAPRPNPDDDEVEEFLLMGCAEVRERMARGEFKPNVCAVMIDFLVRHGEVTAENEPDYAEICSRLHRRLPVPTVSDL